MSDLIRIRGVGPGMAAALRDMGILSASDLAQAEPARLTTLKGVAEGRAALLIAAAQDWLETAEAKTGGETPAVGPAPQDAPLEEAETPDIPGPIIVVTQDDGDGDGDGEKKKKKKKKSGKGKKKDKDGKEKPGKKKAGKEKSAKKDKKKKKKRKAEG